MHWFFNSLHLSWLWTLYFRLLNQRDHVHYTKGFAQPGFDWAHGISLYPFLLSKNFYLVFKNIFKEIVEHVYWFAFFYGPWPAFSFSWCMSSSRRCTDCSVKQLWYSSTCQAVHGPRLSIKTWLFVALASCPIGSHL